MELPTVHLNGTSAQALFDGTMVAVHAVQDAVEALEHAEPHARDYYVQNDGAFSTASSEHKSRNERIGSVLAELNEMAEYLADRI